MISASAVTWVMILVFQAAARGGVTTTEIRGFESEQECRTALEAALKSTGAWKWTSPAVFGTCVKEPKK